MICRYARVPLNLTKPLPEGTVLTAPDGCLVESLTVREMNAILDRTSGSMAFHKWASKFYLEYQEIEYFARMSTAPNKYVKLEFDTEEFRSVIKKRLEFVKEVLQNPKKSSPKNILGFFHCMFWRRSY